MQAFEPTYGEPLQGDLPDEAPKGWVRLQDVASSLMARRVVPFLSGVMHEVQEFQATQSLSLRIFQFFVASFTFLLAFLNFLVWGMSLVDPYFYLMGLSAVGILMTGRKSWPGFSRARSLLNEHLGFPRNDRDKHLVFVTMGVWSWGMTLFWPSYFMRLTSLGLLIVGLVGVFGKYLQEPDTTLGTTTEYIRRELPPKPLENMNNDI